MPWNANGGGPQNPWGQGQGNQPNPPDMEKILQMARERWGGGSSGNGFKAWPILLLIAFFLWGLTGVYVVGPDEQGVVTRFGRYVQTTPPGPHIHLPYPIEQVTKPKVTQVQRIEVGYRSRGRTTVDIASESLMLTGDENIIDIDLSVQYRVKENGAADFLFRVRNPKEDPYLVVRQAAETSIRQVIGSIESIDHALTAGKERIQADTSTTMQSILDGYNSGIRIIAVQLQQVAPPQEVITAFKDVVSAREDRERSKNEALGYQSDILPKAKGEAERQVQHADGYRAAKVSRALGDTNRFTSLYTEYNRAQDVTKTRLYLETMQEVLSGTNNVILDSSMGNGALPLLPLPITGGGPLAGYTKGSAR